MRKVYVNVTSRVIIQIEDGVDVNEFLDEVDFWPTAPDDARGEIHDFEVRDYEVVDSK